jgi:predicted SnoaL-like aldol condensation-catalyzing enzyme
MRSSLAKKAIWLAMSVLVTGHVAFAVAASPVEERFLIMELMDRYGVVHDLGTPEEYAALFTDDAVLESGTGRVLAKGRDALIKQAQRDEERYGSFQSDDGKRSSFMRHLITNREVNLTGADSAEGSSYVTTIINDKADGPHVFSMIRYQDRYKKVKGEWRIQNRKMVSDAGNPELARKYGFVPGATPAQGAPARGPVRSQADPVVAHPDPEALFTSSNKALHRNKQAALHIERELLQCNQWDRAQEWLTDRYIQHNPMAASGLTGVKRLFIDVLKRPVTRDCGKLSSPVVAVQAEGDYVTVLSVREVKYADDPGKSYTTTWFDTWRFVDGKADEHWDPATLPGQ